MARQTTAGNETWESAYLAFETEAEEVRKFRRRLLGLGAAGWARDARAVELFCGRGGGMRALEEMGFSRVEGVDLSRALLVRYRGPATRYAGDCRYLPFTSRSRDLLMVQGGLHHLLALPHDLNRVLSECWRVLRPEGRLVVVEPWNTMFLTLVHALCRQALVRGLSPKMRAFEVMVRLEGETYLQWLTRPREILRCFDRYFHLVQRRIGWGKISILARPRVDFRPERDSALRA